jgi:hypothetical protein
MVPRVLVVQYHVFFVSRYLFLSLLGASLLLLCAFNAQLLISLIVRHPVYNEPLSAFSSATPEGRRR